MAKDTICGRAEIETIDTIDKECALRGHTRSEAVDHILKLGLPVYLKEFQKIYKSVKSERVA